MLKPNMTLKNAYEDYPIRSDNAVAIPSQGGELGLVTGLDLPAPVLSDVADVDGLALRLRFMSGELFGLVFVILSTLYIFLMPVNLTKQGHLSNMFKKAIKRTLDVVGAIVGLVLSAPVWLILPVLIKLDSPGSVFYTQTRVGANRRRRIRRFLNDAEYGCDRRRERRREDYLGNPFLMIKFRTMVSGAEGDTGPVWASKNDSRITKLGSFMRKTRLDEIPQFLNILTGDMSLVGPRPERPKFVVDLSTKVDNYSNRLQVKPGLTGLAQVENGYDVSIDSVANKVTFDLKYIREWSLWNDFKILCRTFVVVFTGRGAF